MRTVLVFALMLACCVATVAQAPAGPNVCMIILIHPKPGSEMQYTAGHIRHIAWHKTQKDTWTWFTNDVSTGPDTGAQLAGSCGHHWSDFGPEREKFMAADLADVEKNILPYVSNSQVSYWSFRPDLSRDNSPEGQNPPAPYLSVTHFFLRPDGITAFTDSIKKVNEGAQKSNHGTPGRIYQLINGGEGPHFVLVVPRKSLADLQPPDKTLDQMMADAFGDEGKSTMDSLRKSYHRVVTELLHSRPDLSYTPAGK